MHSTAVESRIQNRQRQLLLKLFSLLSNEDSLRIFELTSQGANVSNITQKMKIPKSQYYKKLGELGDFGLINRDDDGVYRHTLLGEIIYQDQVITLRKIAADTNLFEQMLKFSHKNKSSNKNFETAVREITREVIAKSDPGMWRLGELRIFETIEEYYSSISSLISKAKNDVYLAVRGLELPIVNSLLVAAERNVRINMLYTDWRGFYSENNLDPLDELLIAVTKKHPAVAKLLNDNSTISIRRSKLQYGFVVSDNKQVLIEIADPQDPQSFFVGIGLDSEALAKKLVSYYTKLVRMLELGKN